MDLTPAPPPSPCLNWLAAGESPREPCFVLDCDRLSHNNRLLAHVQAETGAKILLALKAFSNWPVFPLLTRHESGCLWGACASGVDEARLAKEKFGGEVHAFAAAWTKTEINELLGIADHIVFNSENQWLEHRQVCRAANETFRKHNPVSFGFRLNPENPSTAPAIYNPASPASRLGIRANQIRDKKLFAEMDGLHFHALCEQGAEDLRTACACLENNFGPLLTGKKWLNFGGGHHITRTGYNLKLLKEILRDWRKRYKAQIYLEPGEAVALNAGWLTATTLDIVEADVPTAICDVSAACHMPDVLEMPYAPPLWLVDEHKPIEIPPSRESGANVYRLAGKSCLTGDVIGLYQFPRPLRRADKLIFGDMAIYSMVKTNTFNGLRLPSIGSYSSEKGFRMLREFGYDDFMTRLG